MDMRSYEPGDHTACLAVFDSNTPRFFHPSERAGFEEFLENHEGPYMVMEHEGAVVGCGGWAREGGQFASLTWGMVRADLHGMGLGKFLLFYRLREIGKVAGVERVLLTTSQETAEFFRKQGFKADSVVKDGHAPGVDRVEMVMKLNVCA